MPVQKLFIFDLDGTLVDSFRNIQKSLNHALQSYGFKPHDLESTKQMVGNGMKNLVKRAIPDQTPSEMVEKIHHELKNHYAENPTDETQPYEGITDVLHALKGHQLAVLTNKPHPLALEVMKQTNLEELFGQIFGQRDGVPIKPDPGVLDEINRYNLSKTDIWMIGDGQADAEFARNARINFIGVTWGNTPKSVLEPFGKVVQTTEELKKCLQECIK